MHHWLPSLHGLQEYWKHPQRGDSRCSFRSMALWVKQDHQDDELPFHLVLTPPGKTKCAGQWIGWNCARCNQSTNIPPVSCAVSEQIALFKAKKENQNTHGVTHYQGQTKPQHHENTIQRNINGTIQYGTPLIGANFIQPMSFAQNFFQNDFLSVHVKNTLAPHTLPHAPAAPFPMTAISSVKKHSNTSLRRVQTAGIVNNKMANKLSHLLPQHNGHSLQHLNSKNQ